MTTTYDRMRAAADNLDQFAEDCRNPNDIEDLANQLRADADRLEDLESDMIAYWPMGIAWADRIRGGTP